MSMSEGTIISNCINRVVPLLNDGNTCYCNAIVQAILHTDIIVRKFAAAVEKLMKDADKKKEVDCKRSNGECVMSTFLQTIYKYASFKVNSGSKLTLLDGGLLDSRPVIFKRYVEKEKKAVLTEQQCAIEFVTHFISCLLEASHHHNLHVQELLQFVKLVTLTCTGQCKQVKYELKYSSNVIRLNIMVIKDLQHLLTKQLKENLAEDIAKFCCEKPMKAEVDLVYAPDVIIICIDRSIICKSGAKSKCPVQINEVIRIQTIKCTETYNQPSIVCHLGTSGFGHYEAYVPVPYGTGGNMRYYRMNDNLKNDGQESQSKEQALTQNDVIMTEANVLIYQKASAKMMNSTNEKGIEKEKETMLSGSRSGISSPKTEHLVNKGLRKHEEATSSAPHRIESKIHKSNPEALVHFRSTSNVAKLSPQTVGTTKRLRPISLIYPQSSTLAAIEGTTIQKPKITSQEILTDQYKIDSSKYQKKEVAKVKLTITSEMIRPKKVLKTGELSDEEKQAVLRQIRSMYYIDTEYTEKNTEENDTRSIKYPPSDKVALVKISCAVYADFREFITEKIRIVYNDLGNTRKFMSLRHRSIKEISQSKIDELLSYGLSLKDAINLKDAAKVAVKKLMNYK